jgi:hypothetical protein
MVRMGRMLRFVGALLVGSLFAVPLIEAATSGPASATVFGQICEATHCYENGEVSHARLYGDGSLALTVRYSCDVGLFETDLNGKLDIFVRQDFRGGQGTTQGVVCDGEVHTIEHIFPPIPPYFTAGPAYAQLTFNTAFDGLKVLPEEPITIDCISLFGCP